MQELIDLWVQRTNDIEPSTLNVYKGQVEQLCNESGIDVLARIKGILAEQELKKQVKKYNQLMQDADKWFSANKEPRYATNCMSAFNSFINATLIISRAE